MKLFQEFKIFAVRGNAIDMLVGIVVGAGFASIINSFVKDVLNPPLGLLTGNIDFTSKVWTIKEASDAFPAVEINYGLFISALIDFVIIAFVVFLLVRAINKWKDERAVEETKEKTTKNCRYCFSVISLKAVRCPQCTAENP